MSGYIELKVLMEGLKETTSKNTGLLEQIKEDVSAVKGELNLQDLRLKILEGARNQTKIDVKFLIVALIAFVSMFTSIYTVNTSNAPQEIVSK